VVSFRGKRSAAAACFLLVGASSLPVAAQSVETDFRAPSMASAAGEPSVPHLHRNKALWLISIPAFVAANILDAHSSWSRPESNSLLRGQGGRFDGGSAAIKFGVSGGIILGEYSIIRLFKKNGQMQNAAYAGSAWSNLVGAGVLTGAAVHNYQQTASQTGSLAK